MIGFHDKKIVGCVSKRKGWRFIVFISIAIITYGMLFSAAVASRQLRVGVFQNLPVIFMTEGGDVQGFYADLIKSVAEKEGWEIKFVLGTWAECLERLKTAEIDLMTSITYVKERDPYMDFSSENVLTMWGEVYVLPKSKVENIIALKEKKVALLKGGVNGINFKRISQSFNVDCEIIEVDSYDRVFEMVANGDVNAGVTNNVFGPAHFKEYGLKLSPIMFNPFDMLFAVPEGKNRELLTIIDKYLAKWKQDENSIYYKTLQQWFGKVEFQETISPQWAYLSLALGVGFIVFLFIWMKVLQTQVKARTNEIQKANIKLQNEIKERKKAEEELRLRAQLLDSINDSIFVHDFDGNFIWLNEKACTTRGYNKDELTKLNLEQLDVPEYAESIKPRLKELLGKGASLFESAHFRKDGSIMPIEVHAHLIEMGGRKLVLSVARDISERKRAEEALQESEEKYRLLVENAKDAIFIVQDEIIKFPNPKTEEMTGYSAEELAETPFVNLIHSDDRELVIDRHKRRLNGEKLPGTYSFRIINKAGEQLWVDLNTVIINWEKRPATLNFLRDITKQKNLEAQFHQAQKMESIGTLAGGIAHDFNNILQTISGFSEILLADKDRNDPDYESLEVIKQSSQKAADLIGQLLIFSRKVESELKPVDLNRQIINVSKLLEHTIPKMIRIEHNLAQDLKIINADPLQIEQVLMNLGVNAKDAMPGGGRLILETENITLDEQYCKTHPGAGPGEYVLLSVSDNGHGMDKETLEHIFEPFYTTKEAGKGTGLGLAMAYGVVKGHGGYIVCYSEPGPGTTFKIYFPVLITESPEQRADSRMAPGAEALSGGRETILLVDDDAAVLKVGKAMLERHGYTTIMAESGERAVEIYEKEKELIDLVILDVGMPGMGGHKCLKHLLKLDPGIKVVIATGYAPSGKVKETLESGAVGFIAKPFLLADMLKRAREALA